MESQQKVILVTGASRGIGAATALEFAKPGHVLHLVARTQEKLEATAEKVKQRGAQARVHAVDLSKSDAINDLKSRISLVPDLLVLSAGASNFEPFLKASAEDVKHELSLNYIAPLDITRWVMPTMLKRKSGHIVYVGSLAAVTTFPGNATYAASKAAVMSFARSLRSELGEDSPVGITVVAPGYTNTDMAVDMKPQLPAMEPEEVARCIADAVARGASYAVPGTTNKLADCFSRSFPRLNDWIARRYVRRMIRNG